MDSERCPAKWALAQISSSRTFSVSSRWCSRGVRWASIKETAWTTQLWECCSTRDPNFRTCRCKVTVECNIWLKRITAECKCRKWMATRCNKWTEGICRRIATVTTYGRIYSRWALKCSLPITNWTSCSLWSSKTMSSSRRTLRQSRSFWSSPTKIMQILSGRTIQTSKSSLITSRQST